MNKMKYIVTLLLTSLLFSPLLISATELNSEQSIEVDTLESSFINVTVPAETLESEVNYEKLVDTSVDASRENSGTQTLLLDSQLRTSGIQTISADQELTLLNGTIIEMESGLVRTNGGVNHTVAMYDSLENFGKEEYAIPISGAGFDGVYLETINQDGEYIIHYTMGGGDFYSSLSEVTLIPDELVKAQTHYEIIDGDWYKLVAVDALTSDDYEYINLGTPPEWAQAGTKYYSIDNYTFYDNVYDMVEVYKNNIGMTKSSVTTSSPSSLTYANYFQNLPFRSASNYTQEDYKNFLKAKGQTGSAYYGTSGFNDAQDKEYVNSLLLFAFANHESAYGTSEYANTCYNFFGRSAFDSDPDQACLGYDFTNAYSGIMAQAVYLQTDYFDVYDWRYSGTHVGDKTSGMNVYYATDENWGLKIASHANAIDEYLGGDESGLYQIINVKDYETVYKDKNLSTPLKVLKSSDNNIYNYTTGQMKSENVKYGTNYIVRSEGSGYYEIQLDTPINLSSSGTCRYYLATEGTYPNFEGYSNVSVPTGTSGYPCDYSNWSSQKGYIDKSNVTKLTTSDPVLPEDPTVYGTCSNLTSTENVNGNIVKTYTSDTKNKECIVTYYGSSSTQKTKEINYFTKSGTVKKSQDLYYYNSDGKKYEWNHRDYYSNGVTKYHIRAKYRSNGTRYVSDEWYYNSSGVKSRWDYKSYYGDGVEKYYIRAKYRADGTRYVSDEWFYNSKGLKYQWDYRAYHANGKTNHYTRAKYRADGTRYVADDWYYNSSGQKQQWEYRTYHANGRVKSYTRAKYRSDGTRYVADDWYYNTDGIKTSWKYWAYHSNGKPKYTTVANYKSNGTRSSAVNSWYSTSGYMYQKETLHYDSLGYYSYSTFNYY